MTGSLLCCALFGWIICVTVVRCELSTVQKCNKQQLQHQTLNVSPWRHDNHICVLPSAVYSVPSLYLPHKHFSTICVKHGRVRSVRGSCQGSGVCCYSWSIETSREWTARTRDAQRNTWMTDRQTDTETLKLKVISHGNETEARSGAVTLYTEPQRHPSVRDGHMSAISLTGLKISIHLFI